MESTKYKICRIRGAKKVCKETDNIQKH